MEAEVTAMVKMMMESSSLYSADVECSMARRLCRMSRVCVCPGYMRASLEFVSRLACAL
jgi:hypothetical protein